MEHTNPLLNFLAVSSDDVTLSSNHDDGTGSTVFDEFTGVLRLPRSEKRKYMYWLSS